MEMDAKGPRVCSPEEVEISTQPWVQGTSASAYFGPVALETTFPGVQGFELAFGKLLGELRAIAATMGANYIVGFEMSIDPFHSSGVVLKLVGTAAHLKPMF